MYDNEDQDCWSSKTTDILDWSVEEESASYSPLFKQQWNKTDMYLAPGAYCTYKTTHDTKLDFDSDKVDASYYTYEGNNLPGIGLCRLSGKTSNRLNIVDPLLKTGLLDGLLSGNCGFFVVLHNKNMQVETKISLYKSTEEFNEAKNQMKNGFLAAAILALSIHYWLKIYFTLQ